MPRGKILLADDNKLVVKITTAILEDADYEVEVAWDGIEAISKAYTSAPDLIVLDIEMPKINGYQVCRLLKDDRITVNIPIVMMTARDQQADLFWGMKTGADAYITKGFKPDKFLDLIDVQIKKERARREGGESPEVAARKLDGEGVFNRVIDILDSKLFESTILSELGALASAGQDYHKTIRSVLELIHRVIGNLLGVVLLFKEDEMVISVSQSLGGVFLEEARDETIELATRYGWQASHGGSPKVTVYGDEMLVEGDGAKHRTKLSHVHIFLKVRNKVIGVLLVSGYQTPVFMRRTQEILNMAQNQITIVVDNARLYEAARRLAITDGLTKLYNHRFFQELFEREFRRSERYSTVFSLIMLDIDHFKKINDTYGHLCGDEILRGLAELIKDCLRSIDTVARYGGEEFAILLPETGGAEAVKTAERIRCMVEEHTFSGNDEGLKTTVSLGVATYPSPGVHQRSDVLAKADAAMYEAKEGGRNRVCFRE